MRKGGRLFVGLATASVMIIASSGAAVAARLADITGKWQFSVQTENGPGSPVVTFKQEADKLTGEYVSQALGTAPLLGTVKDKKVDFVVKANVQGQAVDVAFKGTIEADETLKGTLDIAGLGGGTFTAKRQQ